MTIENFIKKQADAKAAYLAIVDTAPRAKLEEASAACKAANSELEAAIAEGAKPCPSCGSPAFGMLQNWSIEKETVQGFEVGCRSCKDHLAVGYFAEDLDARRALAVKSWNAGPDKWWKESGSPVRHEPGKNGEVMLRIQHPGQEKPVLISCKVSEPTPEEIADKQEELGRDNKGGPTAAIDPTEARDQLFVERLKARDARVQAFRDKHETPPPTTPVETVA